MHDVPFALPSSAKNGTRGFSRYGLIGARMTRTLSPQLEQNPIKVSGYCTGGRAVPPPDGQAGSQGAWCYDEEGTTATKRLLAECAEAGVEMFVFPQVSTTSKSLGTTSRLLHTRNESLLHSLLMS